MRDKRSQFVSLFLFLTAATLVLSNGFFGRIFAQGQERDVYQEIEPIGNVLDEILKNYYKEPELPDVVEGAVRGMMNSLDEHSSYIPKRAFKLMTEETDGAFTGIGVSIQLNEDKNVMVFQPIPGSPAAKVGVMAGDIIYKIDDTPTKGMALDEARDLIRGPRHTTVHLTLVRPNEDADVDPEVIEVDIKRDTIPLESIEEARVLEGGIGYVRLQEFRKTTAKELAKRIDDLKDQGMKSLVLDLRWNPGGLLTSAKEVSELFLPKNALVTYTKGRNNVDGTLSESMRLYTEKRPILPEEFPLIVLVNENTASSSEIVTGALQYWSRALIVGAKTYGKGSVQTIIPLARPEDSAIRLTTALYYTPAEVTIDKQGILPDVEVPMAKESWRKLWEQMFNSYKDDPSLRNSQNHGTVTGNELTEETVEDVQLQRAVEILREDPDFSHLIAKYHKDTHVTQQEASPEEDKVASADAVEPSTGTSE